MGVAAGVLVLVSYCVALGSFIGYENEKKGDVRVFVEEKSLKGIFSKRHRIYERLNFLWFDFFKGVSSSVGMFMVFVLIIAVSVEIFNLFLGTIAELG